MSSLDAPIPARVRAGQSTANFEGLPRPPRPDRRPRRHVTDHPRRLTMTARSRFDQRCRDAQFALIGRLAGGALSRSTTGRPWPDQPTPTPTKEIP